MKSFSFFFVILQLTIFNCINAQNAAKPNILFIFVDDLRPDLGCYGNKEIHSPNIDKLASSAILFANQFVTVPTCGASRASILTGLRPTNTDDLSNDVLELRMGYLNRKKERPESFIAQLKENGYYTVGIGKISHSPDGYIYKYLQPKSQKIELPESWNEMLFDHGKWGTGWNAFFGNVIGSNRNIEKGRVKPYENADVDDEAYPDGLTSKLAVQKLGELKNKKQPFFLGIGFFKPHLPFNSPKKYWDLYDESALKLSPAPNLPLHTNLADLHESAEFNGYKEGDEQASLSTSLSNPYAQKIRHAYYAAVSYIDAQIGKVFSALHENGLDKNTIILLWGDHGWHLGDHMVWGKHTLNEWALRSPFILKIPDQKNGVICNRIISSVDIYPTILELCGLTKLAPLDGSSLVPLIKNTDDVNWNDISYSYYNNGITMRNNRYRLTKYFRKQENLIELFDHVTDPYENNNIAAENPALVNKLLPLLEKGNTGLYKK